MAYKFNPLSGQIEDQSQGVQGPTGSVAAATDGSAASPSITFTNDSGTGLFRNGNTLGVAGNNASGFQGELLSVRGSHSIKLSGDSIANTFYIVTDANDSILSINGGSSAQHSDSSYINLHGKSSSNGKIKIVAANPSSGTKGNIQF